MKKKLAFSIAGAAAALIGGWKLVQQLVDRGEVPATVATGSPVPVQTASKPEAGPVTRAPLWGSDSSKAELYEIATELKIKGRSKMSKAELLKAIEDAS